MTPRSAYCRYVLRLPIAQERLQLTADGKVLLRLRRTWRDGTRPICFEPTERDLVPLALAAAPVPGDVPSRAQNAMVEFRAAAAAGDKTRGERALVELAKLLEDGATDEHTWSESEVTATIDLRRRLAETGGRHLERLNGTLTKEEAAAFLAALVVIVKKYVHDTDTLEVIAGDIRRISGGSVH